MFYASLIIGVLDFALKIYIPKGGTLFIYAHDHPASAVAAAGPVARHNRHERDSDFSSHPAARALINRHRLRWWEPLPWLLALAFYFVFPRYLGFGTEVLITVLFAISLDLALGYAGIVTLGHAAFFGAGAYTVGMLANNGIWTEPITGLLISAAVAAAVGFASGLVLLRTTGLTLLMLTLCTMGLLEEAANLGHDWSPAASTACRACRSSRCSGCSSSTRCIPNTQYLYVLGVLLVCFVFVRTLVYSPFGQSLTGIRENTLRMHAVGAPVRWRLILCYTISAALAGIAGALWAQANAYVNLSVLGLDRAATVLIVLVLGGYGRLYGASSAPWPIWRWRISCRKAYPTAWQLGLGLLLVVIALFARGGILGFRRRAAGASPRQDSRHDRSCSKPASLSKSFGALTRHARRHLRAGARRAARADRTERRRQDHVHQSPDRRADAERRQVLFKGRTSRKSSRPNGSSSASPAPSRSTSCSAASRCWRTSTWRSPSGSAPRRTCSRQPAPAAT